MLFIIYIVIVRPGFVRLSFAYFLSEKEFEYILSAVEFVANEGWKLLPFYTFYPDTAQWVHKQYKKESYRRWIGQISYSSTTTTSSPFTFNYPPYSNQQQKQGGSNPSTSTSPPTDEEDIWEEYLQNAKDIVSQYSQDNTLTQSSADITNQDHLVQEKYKHLNWMLFPSQAMTLLRSQTRYQQQQQQQQIQQPKQLHPPNLPFSSMNSTSTSNSTSDLTTAAPSTSTQSDILYKSSSISTTTISTNNNNNNNTTDTASTTDGNGNDNNDLPMDIIDNPLADTVTDTDIDTKSINTNGNGHAGNQSHSGKYQ